ncbi:MAG: Fic family protein, partial [Planctomycetes bacterium]|nr:Fic family protein [Planctomycetota bacterium]
GWHLAIITEEQARWKRLARGQWRDDHFGPMQVASGPPDNHRVHFEAPAAKRLDAEMQAFFDWFNADTPEDPVLKAALAHLWFVTLHPFDDGNGRIARAVAEMALAKADQSGERFYSMSSLIAEDRDDYYRILETVQNASLDVSAWMVWFWRCYDRTLDAAEVLHAKVRFKARFWQWLNRFSTNERQRLVLKRMLGDWEGPLTTSKYAKLAKCSTDTALRDILALVKYGVLVKNEAGGRSTSYRLLGPAELSTLQQSSLRVT